ncbi:MAG: chorismate synthase, partial [Promethearchaeota archaeon]
KRFPTYKVGAHSREIAGIEYAGSINITDLREKTESNIVRCYDPEVAEKMIEAIEAARKDNDSVGGIVECEIHGVPAGIGDPLFNNVESQISSMMFSIGGVKAIEFGVGFKAAKLRGSENNDPFRYNNAGDIEIVTNNAGGILGGITTGQPIVFRLAIKPTSSIGRAQQSINLNTRKNVILEYEGRHDPCIVPRAVPVVESAASIVMLDLLIGSGLIPRLYSKTDD